MIRDILSTKVKGFTSVTFTITNLVCHQFLHNYQLPLPPW